MKKALYILTLINLLSCNYIDPFHDDGNYTEKRIEVSDFSRIEIHNIFNIELIEDAEHYLVYKGGKRILDEMRYSSIEGVLSLDHNFMNWAKTLKIPTLEIHMSQLQSLNLHASATLQSLNQLSGNTLLIDIQESANTYEFNLNINYDILSFHSRGSVGGTLSLSGNCKKSSYALNGSSNIQALALLTDEVSISQNSLGNSYVYVKNKLNVNFFKSGHVYYKGNPQQIGTTYTQINNQDASGKLIKITD